MQPNVKPANVNVWLHPEIKQEAEDILARHGLTISEAIIAFINHVCYAGDFPMELQETRWQDPTSLAALEESKRIEANLEDCQIYKSAAAVIADCLERIMTHVCADISTTWASD